MRKALWTLDTECNMAAATAHITDEHARRFESDGFFILEGVLTAAELELLRGECGRLVDERDREMDRHGVDKLDLDHRGRRYFVHAYRLEPGGPAVSCPPG